MRRGAMAVCEPPPRDVAMADHGRGATPTTTSITTGRIAGTIALLYLWQPNRDRFFQRGVWPLLHRWLRALP